MVTFEKGHRVRITGLKSNSNINGTVGTVCGYVGDKIAVEFDKGVRKGFRQSNVVPVEQLPLYEPIEPPPPSPSPSPLEGKSKTDHLIETSKKQSSECVPSNLSDNDISCVDEQNINQGMNNTPNPTTTVTKKDTSLSVSSSETSSKPTIRLTSTCKPPPGTLHIKNRSICPSSNQSTIKAKDILSLIIDTWLSYYGPPKLLVHAVDYNSGMFNLHKVSN